MVDNVYVDFDILKRGFDALKGENKEAKIGHIAKELHVSKDIVRRWLERSWHRQGRRVNRINAENLADVLHTDISDLLGLFGHFDGANRDQLYGGVKEPFPLRESWRIVAHYALSFIKLAEMVRSETNDHTLDLASGSARMHARDALDRLVGLGNGLEDQAAELVLLWLRLGNARMMMVDEVEMRALEMPYYPGLWRRLTRDWPGWTPFLRQLGERAGGRVVKFEDYQNRTFGPKEAARATEEDEDLVAQAKNRRRDSLEDEAFRIYGPIMNFYLAHVEQAQKRRKWSDEQMVEFLYRNARLERERG